MELKVVATSIFQDVISDLHLEDVEFTLHAYHDPSVTGAIVSSSVVVSYPSPETLHADLFLNLLQCSDVRDVVVIIAHEARHVWQHFNMPTARDSFDAAKTVHDAAVYRKLPTERDADLYGFQCEARLDYHNETVTEGTPSFYEYVKGFDY